MLKLVSAYLLDTQYVPQIPMAVSIGIYRRRNCALTPLLKKEQKPLQQPEIEAATKTGLETPVLSTS